MKKSIISICITLFIFIGSMVPVFATEVVADNMVEYWLHDLLNQSFLSHNAADVTFGLGVGNSVTSYVVKIVQGGTFYVTYEVAPGDTVYFRWAQIRNNIPINGSTVVNTSVNGSRVNSNTYTRAVSSSDDTGTYGTVLIVEDYTNTTNAEQTVAYTITFNGDGGMATGDFIPILCGTSVLINADKVSIDVSNFPSFDLTTVEDKLDDIIELLQKREEDIDFEVPFDLWQLYSFFINGYDYSYLSNSSKVPWLTRNSTQSESFNDSLAFRSFHSHRFYFSFLTWHKDFSYPKLIGRDGTVLNPYVYYESDRNSTFGTIMTYRFNIPENSNEYFTLYLPDTPTYNTFIPLYLGDEFNIPESIESYIGLPSERTKLFDTISSTLNSIYDFISGSSSVSDNANVTNDNLSNTVTQFDNIEKEQVNNFTQNIANLPSFDFGSISDFSTTANFVSTQMQNIYNSSDYIKFIYTAVLTFGIALVLIGRGLRR